MAGQTFEGALATPFNMSWSVMTDMTPDNELDSAGTLKTLRRNAKQLIKDDSVAAGVQQAYINLISTPMIRVESTNRIQQQQIAPLVEDFSGNSSISGDETIYQLLDQIQAWAFADGDILVNLTVDKDRPGLKTVVELVEANRIDTPTDLPTGIKNRTKLGVRYDSLGRLEGYYVKNADAVGKNGNTQQYYTFYPSYRGVGALRRKVTHLFKAPLAARPKQSRQYPVLSPVITTLKMLKDYKEAVILGARVAACFSAFITTNNPANTWKGFTTDASGNVTDPQNPDNRATKLQPATIAYLRPNESVTFASPNRPSDNADPFILRLHKIISAYLRIPYPILFSDYAELSYSALKGASIDAQKTVSRWRRDIANLLTWIYKTVALEALSLGVVRGSIDSLNVKLRWPANGVFDPEKEARANRLRLSNKEASHRMLIEESGNSAEEVNAEILSESLRELEEQAILLAKRKELSEKYQIVFPEDEEKTVQRRGQPREGEDADSDEPLSEDDKKERRKEDGNW